jgi:hypothetical protein
MGFPNNKITNGLSGGQHISTTSASGDWIAIQVLADAKFSVLVGNMSDVANANQRQRPDHTRRNNAVWQIHLHDAAQRTSHRLQRLMILAPTLTLNTLARGYDADATAFAAASGATDVAALSAFVKGVKELGLWSNMVCWPLRSSQNAGTGTTAFSLGGLGTYNGTLTNGPTWGADGPLQNHPRHRPRPPLTMSYETTSRTIALDPEAVATLFPALLAQYGEALPDGAESITTIGGHWDDSDKTRIRAASLHKGTITGQPLTDGRVAFTCLWQSDLAAAFDAGDIAGVAELSAEELAGLTPEPEGMP